MPARLETITLACALGLPCVTSLGLMAWRPWRARVLGMMALSALTTALLVTVWLS